MNISVERRNICGELEEEIEIPRFFLPFSQKVSKF